MNYKKFAAAGSAALMIVIAVTLVFVPGAGAQTKYKTLHRFTEGKSGWEISARLIFDQAGNLYGTTVQGGNLNYCNRIGCGVVFKLTPNADGSWTESVLHSFNGKDGADPYVGLVLDQAGSLYGTTSGGGADGAGVVFKLTPNAGGSWTESVLHSFHGSDGSYPYRLTLDPTGNLYGATVWGGTANYGNVFKLTPNTHGSWTESVLHNFCSLTSCSDGANPSDADLIFDADGNLYGVTTYGGAYGGGVAFELTPNSDGSWMESVLYNFTGDKDGGLPTSLIFDAAGNLYGTTVSGGAYGDGIVFTLVPRSDGSWTESVLHNFTGGKDGGDLRAGLIFDQVGNLYGITRYGGNLGDCSYGCGVVFKLVRNSTGAWHETVLHYFAGHPGEYPFGGLIWNAAGDLYGTTRGDGTTTFGSVFEITP